jgi:hypothetical protein
MNCAVAADGKVEQQELFFSIASITCHAKVAEGESLFDWRTLKSKSLADNFVILF